MSRFLAARLQAISPYTPGEQPRGEALIKLNTNESPFPPSPLAVEAAAQAAVRLNLYSDPACRDVKLALARAFDVSTDEVFAGNGSDEVLTLIFAALCPQGVAFADITYGFYPVLSGLFAVEPLVVPLREDFRLAVDDYRQIGKTIVIANPNAPTGLAISLPEIEELLRTNLHNLVVLDEAYVDFGAQSAVPLVGKYDNLMVVGTFSKSRAMAGARFGYAVANKALIADLERIKYSFNPYNVNSMTQAAAVAALADEDYFKDCCLKIMQTRAETATKLRALGFEVTDSKTNFLFIRYPGIAGKILFQQLRQAGILVRRWDLPRINDYLRVTVGTREQMERLYETLQSIVGAAKGK